MEKKKEQTKNMTIEEQLQKIQKTFHIFEILTKIAYIFSIVGAVFCAENFMRKYGPVFSACYIIK